VAARENSNRLVNDKLVSFIIEDFIFEFKSLTQQNC